VADFGVFRGAEPWDLILFRNGAIYLEAEYAHRVWRRLDEQLKPGGAVVTGGAERPPEDLRWKRESAYLYWKALN
jgi:chemotaxis protein methyltransferase CheR